MTFKVDPQTGEINGAAFKAALGAKEASIGDVSIYNPKSRSVTGKVVVKSYVGDAARVTLIKNCWLTLVKEMKDCECFKHLQGVVCDSPEKVSLVMDYIPGGSLDDLRVVNNLTATEKMVILVGVLGQLVELHAKGLVHRGIRPSAIILDQERHPHIVGWQRVRYMDKNGNENESMMSSVIFDPHHQIFVAPEIGHTSEWTQKPDVWSVGLLCLWLIDPRHRVFSMANSEQIQQQRSMIIASFRGDLEWLNQCLVGVDRRKSAQAIFSTLMNRELEVFGEVSWDKVKAYAETYLTTAMTGHAEDDSDADIEEEEEEEEEEDQNAT